MRRCGVSPTQVSLGVSKSYLSYSAADSLRKAKDRPVSRWAKPWIRDLLSRPGVSRKWYIKDCGPLDRTQRRLGNSREAQGPYIFPNAEAKGARVDECIVAGK